MDKCILIGCDLHGRSMLLKIAVGRAEPAKARVRHAEIPDAAGGVRASAVQAVGGHPVAVGQAGRRSARDQHGRAAPVRLDRPADVDDRRAAGGVHRPPDRGKDGPGAMLVRGPGWPALAGVPEAEERQEHPQHAHLDASAGLLGGGILRGGRRLGKERKSCRIKVDGIFGSHTETKPTRQAGGARKHGPAC